MTTRRDYDDDPERYRLGMRMAARHAKTSLYDRIVRLLRDDAAARVLDIGCGDGALAAAAAGTSLRVVGLDAALTMVRAARRAGPVVRGDVEALPVADRSVDAVVAVNVLDHLPQPGRALAEAKRVLRAGGLFVAGAVSRTDSPELAPYWHPEPTPFDAEDAAAQVGEVFGDAESRPWDAPLVSLPDRRAVADYLRARFVPGDEADRLAEAVAQRGPLPLVVTKRGALVLARRL